MPKSSRGELRNLANIEQPIDSGGEITIGRLDPITCAAIANCQRRKQLPRDAPASLQ